MMLATRILRSSKFIVGLGIEDIAGSRAALSKAIGMVRPGDKIVAVHIPKLQGELFLSSMSDPSAAEDIFSALVDAPGKAGDAVVKEIKESSVAAISKLPKDVSLDF